jgi:predicted O-methyltransferase YrrM
MAPDAEFDAAFASVRDVDGWMTQDQARRLWDRARALVPPARVVEIGSYRGRSAIVLAKAASPGVEIVAIDPHAGTDRGPQQIVGTPDEGQVDFERFHANVRAAGVDERVRHVRGFSQEALDAVEGEVDLLYIDGAHRYGPARDDIVLWGARVRAGGTMLIHDSFSSIGVTLAEIGKLFFAGGFRYAGRSQSMTEYRREPVRGLRRMTNALRQVAQLPWFARNVVVKVALVAHLRPLARLLGHRTDTFPY